MKTKLYFLLIFSITLLFSTAQLRHTTGINQLGFNGGVSDLGYIAGIKYGRYVNRNFKIEINPQFEYSSYKNTKSFGGYLLLNGVITVVNINDTYFLGPKIGISASYLTLDVNSNLSNDSEFTKETFAVGPTIGLDNEIYISDHFSVGLDAYYNYNAASSFGKHRIFSTLSMNFQFY